MSKFSIPQKKVAGRVVDMFCGIGGLSHGFFLEGFKIAAGFDVIENYRYAFEQNNEADFICKDIQALKARDVKNLFKPDEPSILIGCAPCQPFSVYNQKNNDPQWRLLEEFSRLIAAIKPTLVSMENVPRLLKFREGRVFAKFIKALEDADYHVDWQLLFAPDYGVPQSRKRLVLLASRRGNISFLPPTHEASNYQTVRDTIGHLPPLSAGEVDSNDQLHRSSRLSPLNLKRIREAKPGGTWRDWDQSLVTSCHKANTGRTYSSVYGRMDWNAPSPTITTQFYGFGNGRFGHPVQDRALSLREGALLQTFPQRYKFLKQDAPIYFTQLGKMIGNAVPVTLAQVIAKSIRLHLSEF